MKNNNNRRNFLKSNPDHETKFQRLKRLKPLKRLEPLESIKIHHLIPSGNKIMYKFLLSI